MKIDGIWIGNRADHILCDAEKGGISPLCMCLCLKEHSSLWKWAQGSNKHPLLGVGGEEALTEADESRCETKATLTQTIFWFELLLTYEELHFSFENQTKATPVSFLWGGGGGGNSPNIPRLYWTLCQPTSRENRGRLWHAISLLVYLTV